MEYKELRELSKKANWSNNWLLIENASADETRQRWRLVVEGAHSGLWLHIIVQEDLESYFGAVCGAFTFDILVPYRPPYKNDSSSYFFDTKEEAAESAIKRAFEIYEELLCELREERSSIGCIKQALSINEQNGRYDKVYEDINLV